MLVDFSLQIRDVISRDPLVNGPGRRQLGAEIEQLALDATQEWVERSRGRQRADQPEMAVEFVHRSEGLDPRMVFCHPGTAKEARLSRITGLCVDLHAFSVSCWFCSWSGNPSVSV
jgi:hypothetical protein